MIIIQKDVAQYDPNCERCQAVVQHFEYVIPGLGVYVWDIRKAIAIVAASSQQREPFLFEKQTIEEVMLRNEIDPKHVDHVYAGHPGIAAPVFDISQNRPAYALIDGTHRAAWCYKHGKPFCVYLLTHSESQQCLLSQPHHPEHIRLAMASDWLLTEAVETSSPVDSTEVIGG